MICFSCDNETFVIQPDAKILQIYKGIPLTIETEASICSKCGWRTLTIPQADMLLARTRAAYRNGPPLPIRK